MISGKTLVVGLCQLLTIFTLGHATPASRHESSLLSSFGKIVDGAGYALHNTGFSSDLAMQANPAGEGERLGPVTLEPFTNGRDQKWGTSFYGTNQVALSSGLHGSNVVSVYYPEGSSRDKARLYAFELIDGPNYYRILNLETNLCLVANQSATGEPIIIEFGSCSEGNYVWELIRTG